MASLPPPGWESPPPPPPGCEPASSSKFPTTPSTAPAIPEMRQMVCGVCRSLLSYPKGAIHVKCPGCQTVNHVLEAHQVGLVKCRSCTVLLMYKYDSPSVRCSCCLCVTEIGGDNKRQMYPMQNGHPPSHAVQ